MHSSEPRRREYLDQIFFWNGLDLHRKLDRFASFLVDGATDQVRQRELSLLTAGGLANIRRGWHVGSTSRRQGEITQTDSHDRRVLIEAAWRKPNMGTLRR